MPRLLLDDDSPTNRRVVELTFAMEDIDVVAVSDGESALEYVGRETVDVALVDLSLPGIDGYSVCRRLKSEVRTAHIPVLLIVGRFDRFDQDLAEQAGYYGHLTKPFETNDLVEMVDQALKEVRSVEPDLEPILSKRENFGISDDERVSGGGSSQVLFEIPLSEVARPVVFALKSYQCHPQPGVLRKLVVDTRRHSNAPIAVSEAVADEATTTGAETTAGVPEQVDSTDPMIDEPPEVEAAGTLEAANPPTPHDLEAVSDQDLNEEQMKAVLDRLNDRLPDVVRSILQEERDTAQEKTSPPAP